MNGALNCWQFQECGRQPGGAKVSELGVCPAASFAPADGFCGGKNGGRACTYVAGTFCSGTVQGTHRDKAKLCAGCEFYRQLKTAHGVGMTFLSFDRYVRDREQKAS